MFKGSHVRVCDGVPGIHWIKLLEDLVEGFAVEAHHGDVCLIILRCKQFLPWGQLQRDQSTLPNLISLMSLLIREGFREVLPIAGMLKHCSPLLCVMTGKAKKEDAIQELYHNDGWGGGQGEGGHGDVDMIRIWK
jgi:hypothetical protein